MAGDLEIPDDYVKFVLRIWLEEGNGASFWRGSVEKIDSGQVSHFEDGSALLRFVNARLVARNGIALARGQAAEPKISPATVPANLDDPLIHPAREG
jgi:hypothetical protein